MENYVYNLRPKMKNGSSIQENCSKDGIFLQRNCNMYLVYNLLQFFYRQILKMRSHIPTIVFVVALFWRSPNLFISPRFWAEEGTLYFDKMQSVGRLGGLLQIVNGNYQLLTNLFVDAASHVPLKFAPFVTTYLSLLVCIYCAHLISQVALERGCGIFSACVGCALFALQPAGYEVFISATNVQWVTSVLTLCLLLSSEAENRSFSNYILVVVCGLTGTTSCILSPLFVIRALVRKNIFFRNASMLLISTTAIQFTVIVLHRGEIHRSFEISSLIPVAMSLQIVLSQVLPIGLVDAIGRYIAGDPSLSLWIGIQITILAAVIILCIAYLALPRLGLLKTAVLVLGMIFVSFVNEVGALAGTSAMLSGWAGGRYFFLGATGFIILLMFTLDGRSRLLGCLALIVVASGTIINIVDLRWSLMFVSGPSFSQQLKICNNNKTCKIDIWPSGWSRNYAL